MTNQLNIRKLVDLKKQELGNSDDDILEKLEAACQSIYHWNEYCQYHYTKLEEVVKPSILRLDRFATFKPKGEYFSARIVYEANIIAFLNSLHALIDSFPYLLNLFIKQVEDSEATCIKWHTSFIDKYDNEPFHHELTSLLLDPTFNKVKGYVNITKHRRLIRIANKMTHLEFEEYKYKQLALNEKGEISYDIIAVTNENVLEFLVQCHDELIPKLFKLCDSIMCAKALKLRQSTG